MSAYLNFVVSYVFLSKQRHFTYTNLIFYRYILN
jgi:hypothetical protein